MRLFKILDRPRFVLTYVLACCLALVSFCPVHAEIPVPKPSSVRDAAEAAKASPPNVPQDFASPRDTLKTFLVYMGQVIKDQENDTAWEQVFRTLDIPEAAGQGRKDNALKLLGVFNGLGRLDPDTMAPGIQEVSEKKLSRFEFLPDNTYPAAKRLIRRAVRALRGKEPPGSIVLVRTESGEWKFDADTLDEIGQLWSWIEKRGVQYGADITKLTLSEQIRKRLVPAALKDRFVLGNELWQWVGLALILFIAVLADYLSRFLFTPIVRWAAHRHVKVADEETVRATVRPLALLAGVLVFKGLLALLLLVGDALVVVTGAVTVVVTVAAAWVGFAVTDLVAGALMTRVRAAELAFDKMLVRLLRRTAKLFILALAFIYAADALNLNLVPLLGSLGLAGLAISFAAQDLIRNLFGGVTIFMDKPFKTGDRILYKGYDGIIEQIGFRSTKLRTLTGHLVTIPNGGLTNEPVENVAQRPSIRRIMNVTITYDTPREKIGQAVKIIEGILEEDGIREPIHSVINGDEFPPRVYFNDFNVDSLNIFVIYWFAPPAYWDYLAHCQQLNLRIAEEFEKADIAFAFPTQTLYVVGDPKREMAIKMLGKDLATQPMPPSHGAP